MIGIRLPTCGYLTVPEDRTAATSRDISLLVVRVRPQGDVSPDPMIVLGLDLPWTTNYPGVAPLATRVHREVIMPAIRGDGRSSPSLVCTEIEDLEDSRPALVDDPAQIVDLAPRAAFMNAVQTCHDRLVSQGVNLAAYNLAESAADVEDLRAALGIEEYNLQTLGTASRLAFEVMRRYPQHIRSVIFDTPSVPQVDMFTEAVIGTRASFTALAAACPADATGCSDVFPDPDGLMAAAMQQLATRPLHVTGSFQDLVLDDAMVLRYLRTRLAKDPSEVLAILRRLVDDETLGREHADRFGGWPILSHGYAEGAPVDVSPGSFRGDFSHGLQYSIACHDQLPYVDRGSLIAETADEPWYQRAFLDSPFLEICERWDVGVGDGRVIEPVGSSIPTLLLVGELDPFGTPAIVRDAAGLLEAAWVVEFPALSHNVLGYDNVACPKDIRNAWIDDPTTEPDTSCVSGIPPLLFEFE